MAVRRQWENLSPKYQARLSRAGITRRQYESGVSLSKARGHRATPERPERAYKTPNKYPEYIQKRAQLSPVIDRITTPGNRDELAERIYAELTRMAGEFVTNAQGKRVPAIRYISWAHIADNVASMPDATFRYAWNLSANQWRDLGRQKFAGPGARKWYDSDAAQSVFGSRAEPNNPFFYH